MRKLVVRNDKCNSTGMGDLDFWKACASALDDSVQRNIPQIAAVRLRSSMNKKGDKYG